jgi:hypothetical protein
MNVIVQWHLVCVCLAVISCGTAYAQERTEQHMVVSAETEEAEHDQFSAAPLFGCTHDSPRVATFVLVSYEFGGAEAIVAPISGNH